MANFAQALAHLTLGAGYALECFKVHHAAIPVALAIAYLIIGLKYLHVTFKK